MWLWCCSALVVASPRLIHSIYCLIKRNPIRWWIFHFFCIDFDAMSVLCEWVDEWTNEWVSECKQCELFPFRWEFSFVASYLRRMIHCTFHLWTVEKQFTSVKIKRRWLNRYCVVKQRIIGKTSRRIVRIIGQKPNHKNTFHLVLS